MTAREYSGAAKRTTLVGDLTATSTTAQLADGTGYPTGASAPFVVTFDLGLPGEEKVLATRSGNSLTLTQRGFDGTTAALHGNGSTVDHTFSATDAREANQHVNAITSATDPHPQYVNTAEGDTAYVRTVGGSTVALPAPTTVGLIVRAASAQTADLTSWADNAGVALAAVQSTGTIFAAKSVNVVGAAAGASYGLFVRTGDAAKTPVIAQGAPAQTGDLQQWQDSAGTVLCAVRSGGQLHTTTFLAAGPNASDGSTQALVTSAATGRLGLLVRGASGQISDLQQWQDSAGTALARIGPSGRAYFNLENIGVRELVLGGLDSAGLGFRSVRVAN